MEDDTTQSAAEVAARAAYRLGLLDAMLHKDVVEALKPPGIIVESMRGEREHRIRELSSVDVSMDSLSEFLLEDK
jgi:hypothetical protein